ncbi:hypothetical protein RND81_13G095900 [Saponaria officinalis]|uniref:Uncharacterized protein n=1 Tax=Saponaria officinalis TaxID=3572 RepID=A0AAW1GXV1_SAPOF
MSANQPIGSCYIWFILISLFICLISGGAFLVLYMTRPVTRDTSWYPDVGISLVCLPWFFWILLIVYRIVSRTFCFRMVCWGANAMPVERGDNVMVDEGLENGSSYVTARTSYVTAETPSSRKIHFEDTSLVNEQDNNKGGSSTLMVLHESERPLKS